MILEKDVSEEAIKNSKILLVTSMSSKSAAKAALKAAKLARKHKVLLVFAPSLSMIRKQPKIAMQLTDWAQIAIMNDLEAMTLTKQHDLRKAMEIIRYKHTGTVIVMLGPLGSVALAGKKFYRQKAFRVEIRDTNGCGDAFTGGFLYAYLKKFSIPKCLEFGSKVAALKIQKLGAERGLPTLAEVMKFKG